MQIYFSEFYMAIMQANMTIFIDYYYDKLDNSLISYFW